MSDLRTQAYDHDLFPSIFIKAKIRFQRILFGIKEPSLAIKRSQALPAIVELWPQTRGIAVVIERCQLYKSAVLRCSSSHNFELGQMVAT